MVKIHEKSDKMMKFNSLLCPKVHKKSEKTKTGSRYWSAVPNGGGNFEVNQGKIQSIIDLQK